VLPHVFDFANDSLYSCIYIQECQLITVKRDSKRTTIDMDTLSFAIRKLKYHVPFSQVYIYDLY